MKITQLFTEQKEREIDLDTPAFYSTFGSKVAVYSEDKVVSVSNLSKGWDEVRKTCISDYSNFIDLVTKATRITEEEFNKALTETISKITGVEIVVPNSVTEEIPA